MGGVRKKTHIVILFGSPPNLEIEVLAQARKNFSSEFSKRQRSGRKNK